MEGVTAICVVNVLVRVPGTTAGAGDGAGRTKTEKSAWEGPSTELGKRRAIDPTLLHGLPASTRDK